MNRTKKPKKERVIVSISLPKDLLDLADERAKQLFKKRSEYFSQLIFFDTRLLTVNNQLAKNTQLLSCTEPQQ
jgi:metal-responsive CopG/Arc/MetJ family transcriptional regulator